MTPEEKIAYLQEQLSEALLVVNKQLDIIDRRDVFVRLVIADMEAADAIALMQAAGFTDNEINDFINS